MQTHLTITWWEQRPTPEQVCVVLTPGMELCISISGCAFFLSSLGVDVFCSPLSHLLILPFDPLAERGVVSSLDMC